MSSACTATRRSGRWCCAWTRSLGIQALDRSQPVLPMMPGVPERRSHDYVRHGTTDLFAAFNIADGTVISQLRRHHRAAEFKKFLARIDKNVPAGLEVHMVCDLSRPRDYPDKSVPWEEGPCEGGPFVRDGAGEVGIIAPG